MSVGADVISVFERKSEKAVAHVKCASFSADRRYLLRMESCRDHNAINSKIVIGVVGDIDKCETLKVILMMTV